MRILMIAATYPPTRCGVGDYVRRVAHELVGPDAEVFVLTGESEDPDHDHGDPTVAEVGPRPAPRTDVEVEFERDASGVHLARAVEAWDWTALDLVDAALRTVRPDVVNLQYHGEDYLLHPAVCTIPDMARQRGPATVTTLHNLQQPLQWEAADDPLDHLLRSSAAWICTNTIDEKRLLAHDAASGRLHRVPTGPCITAAVARERPPVEGPLRVGYFGFLNPFKGIEFLLRAVARVRDRGLDVHLEMAAGIHTDAPGRLRDYGALIDREIETLALGPVLTRRGFVSEEEVGLLLGRSHVAAFPFREGLSGKNSSFWSTMHHAAPTLTTRGDGLPDGLIDGDNTLLVDPQDVEGLARKLEWASEHRGELEEIGARGKAFVERSFAWEAIAGRMREIFAASRASRAGGST